MSDPLVVPDHAPVDLAGSRVKRNVFFITLTLALLLVAYLPALNGGWLWDDEAHVTENMMLRDARGLNLIWTRLGATPQYYPLTHTTFWVEWRLFGLETTGYHVVNLLLHAAATLLLWRVLKLLDLRAAGWIALLWSLHPVQVETVAWISELKNTQSTFFYLAAAYFYLRSEIFLNASSSDRARRLRLYAFSLLLFMAAVLSKTVAGSLPAALIVVLWWRRQLSWRAALTTAPMFAVSVVMALLTKNMERDAVGARGPEWDFSFADRLLIASRATCHYVSKLFWPSELSFVYPRWTIDPQQAWQWSFLGIVVVATGCLMAVAWRGVRGPLAGWCFFGGTVFPALGFVNLYPMKFSFVADHFQYLAGVGIVAVAVEGLRRVVVARGKTGPVGVVGGLVVVGLTFMTGAHAGKFSSSEILWKATIETNPTAWLALDHLTGIYTDKGDYDTALQYCRRSSEVSPNRPEPYLALADIMSRLGRTDEMMAALRHAVELRPNDLITNYRMGTGLAALKDYDGAAKNLERVLEIDRRYEPARIQLALVERTRGRNDRAAELFREGIKLFPESAQCRVQWGDLLMSQNKPAEALTLYEQALQLQPTSKPLADRITKARQAK